MSTSHVCIMALSAMAGALYPIELPWWPAASMIVIALAVRQPLLLIVAVALVTSALSAHAWKGLDEPVPATVRGVATVVKDAERTSFGELHATARLEGRHYQLVFDNQMTTLASSLMSGQKIELAGRTEPLSRFTAPYLRRRHVAARIRVDELAFLSDGGVATRMANAFRTNLDSGADSLSDEQRALVNGLVVGDDREQSPEIEDAFEEAGLSHLLAVSGQNVAFVLLVATPLLQRLRIGARLCVGLGLLLAFGTITRWEPSVVRAEVMAAVLLIADHLGRAVSLWRLLGLAVTVALMIDPFLAGSIGFLLSAGACVGMAAFGEPLSRVLPGPQWLRRCFGYSAAAQLGVSPILQLVFGGTPVVALLSNALVEPAAAFVMVWGFVMGTIGGILGEPVSGVIHLPTRVVAEWMILVAQRAAGAQLGNWHLGHLWIPLGIISLTVVRRRRPGGAMSRLP
jgi:competence protein ComEC